ncbi:hypothetical protein EDC19_2811 [Natranaerovirga hydrolytica]|uniref:Uncharacterized protein n=1 Tax=Natranaerovirga hydrolytica TaxID=680378 RepID=A0A4R1M594_9FIRM|nr:hypothetical protein [Natranaerovirga hydrolytica]TCK86757.1 hypothetical protein EDC19_2811 [Natranaerovirga hydrolytica]
MKIIKQPVDMIAYFNVEGILMPIKFRLESDDKMLKTIKISNVLYHTEEKFAGNLVRTYACNVIIDAFEKPCELKYHVHNCKWFLFKI